MIEYILFVLGFVFLIKGAGYLVDGSSALAKKLRVPSLIIGLTVVAFGTSMPELIVNIFAAVEGVGDIAFGNIIGSNMLNILLILGIAALITSLKVQHSTVWKEIPFSFLAVVVLLVFSSAFFLNDFGKGYLSRIEGIILLLFLAIFLYYVFDLAKRNKSLMIDSEMKIKSHSYFDISLMIFVGLVGLYFGGKWVVDGAVIIAKLFGLSEFFISATIVAIGTSLPELVTSIVATLKKDFDLAVGNIIGSNIFNIFLVLGVTAVINPIKFPLTITIDLLILLVATLFLFLFMFLGKKHELDRWQGVMFIAFYVVYIIFLLLRG